MVYRFILSAAFSGIPRLRSLILCCLTAASICRHAVADFNPQRIGFTTIQPISYADWPTAFLAGNGKIGMMVLGNPRDEIVVFNDRGFNLSNGTVRSFDQVSA